MTIENNSSHYPTQECLTEISLFKFAKQKNEELPKVIVSHLNSCDFCKKGLFLARQSADSELALILSLDKAESQAQTQPVSFVPMLRPYLRVLTGSVALFSLLLPLALYFGLQKNKEQSHSPIIVQQSLPKESILTAFQELKATPNYVDYAEDRCRSFEFASIDNLFEDDQGGIPQEKLSTLSIEIPKSLEPIGIAQLNKNDGNGMPQNIKRFLEKNVTFNKNRLQGELGTRIQENWVYTNEDELKKYESLGEIAKDIKYIPTMKQLFLACSFNSPETGVFVFKCGEQATDWTGIVLTKDQSSCEQFLEKTKKMTKYF